VALFLKKVKIGVKKDILELFSREREEDEHRRKKHKKNIRRIGNERDYFMSPEKQQRPN